MGYGNMAKMAQQMQAEMARVQAELDALTLEGTAGGGAVTAVGQRPRRGRVDHASTRTSSIRTTSRCSRT